MNDTNIFDLDKPLEGYTSLTDEKIFDIANLASGFYSPRGNSIATTKENLNNLDNIDFAYENIQSENAKIPNYDNNDKDKNSNTTLNSASLNIASESINKDKANSNIEFDENKIILSDTENNYNNNNKKENGNSNIENELKKKINIMTHEEEKAYFEKLKERDKNEKLTAQMKQIQLKNGQIAEGYYFNKDKNMFEKNEKIVELEKELKNFNCDNLNPNLKYAKNLNSDLAQKVHQNPEKIRENFNKHMIEKVNPSEYLDGVYNKNMLKEIFNKENNIKNDHDNIKGNVELHKIQHNIPNIQSNIIPADNVYNNLNNNKCFAYRNNMINNFYKKNYNNSNYNNNYNNNHNNNNSNNYIYEDFKNKYIEEKHHFNDPNKKMYFDNFDKGVCNFNNYEVNNKNQNSNFSPINNNHLPYNLNREFYQNPRYSKSKSPFPSNLRYAKSKSPTPDVKFIKKFDIDYSKNRNDIHPNNYGKYNNYNFNYNNNSEYNSNRIDHFNKNDFHFSQNNSNNTIYRKISYNDNLVNNCNNNDNNQNRFNIYNINDENLFHRYDNNSNKFENNKKIAEGEPEYRVRKTQGSRILYEFEKDFKRTFFKISVPEKHHTETKHIIDNFEKFDLINTSNLGKKIQSLKELLKKLHSEIKDNLIIFYMFLYKSLNYEINLKEKKIHRVIEPVQTLKVFEKESEKNEFKKEFDFHKSRDKSPISNYGKHNKANDGYRSNFRSDNRRSSRSKSYISNVSKSKDRSRSRDNLDSKYNNDRENNQVKPYYIKDWNIQEKSRKNSNISNERENKCQIYNTRDRNSEEISRSKSKSNDINRINKNQINENNKMENHNNNYNFMLKSEHSGERRSRSRSKLMNCNQSNNAKDSENFKDLIDIKLEVDENDSKLETQISHNAKSKNYKTSDIDHASNSNNSSFLNKQLHEILQEYNLKNQDKEGLVHHLMSIFKEENNVNHFPKALKNTIADDNQSNNNKKINETNISQNNLRKNLQIEEKQPYNKIKNANIQNETILPLNTNENSFCFDKITSPLSKERFINKDLHLNEIDNSSDKSKSINYNDLSEKSKQEFSIKNRTRSDSYIKLKIENNIQSANNVRRNNNKKKKNQKNQLKNQYINTIRNESQEKSDTPEFNARINLKQEEEKNQINEKKNEDKIKAKNEINKEDKKKELKEIQKISIRDNSNNNKQIINSEMKNNSRIKNENKESINTKSVEKINLNLVSENTNNPNNSNLLGKKRKCENSKNDTDEESLQIKKIPQIKQIEKDPSDDLFENSENEDDIGNGKFKEKEKHQLKMDEIIDISKLIMDDGKKCLGHKSFDSMEKFIGKNRVKNLNAYMKKHENGLLSEKEKKNGVIFFKNEIEEFIIALRVSKNNTFVIYNSKKILLNKNNKK